MPPSIIPKLIPFIIEGSEEEEIPLPEEKVYEYGYEQNEEDVLGTTANIRYYHLKYPWNAPLSFGVQAFIEFNGFIINDRYQSDLIRVTKIVGLDDAEVRDSRQAKGGKSGEWAYDAFYGGRNLVLSGFIEAGSLQVLTRLEQNFKAAYAPLEESQFKFRWFDVYEPFDDPDTILPYNPTATVGNPGGNYIPLLGKMSSLKVENGLLTWREPTTVAILREAEKRTYCDVQMTMKVNVGEINDGSGIGFILCAKDSENYLVACLEGARHIKISVYKEGEYHDLWYRENTSLHSGQSFWLRGRKENNEVFVELYNNDPQNSSYDAIAGVQLEEESRELYGDEVLSQVGIYGMQTNNKWSVENFKIESIYPGDIEFKARKLNLSIPSEQTSLTRFKRPFQLTMKASDFRAVSSTQLSNYIIPSETKPSVMRERKYPRSYPIEYKFLSSIIKLSPENNLLSINNRGSVYTEPILYLYGSGENILISNLTNGQIIEWLGVVKEGDYIKIDCAEETIENSVESDYLGPLVPTVEWIKLEPMWNDLLIQGSNFGPGTKFKVVYRHGYM